MATTDLVAVAGGVGGSWYALMEGLAALVAAVHPAIRIEVVAGGGVSNHERVGSGDVAMGILNPPMTAAALAGRPPFGRAHPDLRVAVANLTVNYLHCFVERALPLGSVDAWLAGRHPLRMPVDRVGTVDRLVFRHTLAHFGVSEPDIATWGGELVAAQNYDEQLALYREGRVNALWQFMGVPSPSIQAAHALRPLKALALPPGLIAALGEIGWAAAVLPAGAYGATGEAVPTVAMGTSLGFHAAVPDALVHAITAAICDHPDRVRSIHEAAGRFDPDRAHLEARGPLHPGAQRYLSEREAGRSGRRVPG